MEDVSQFIKSLEEATDLIISKGDETLVLADLQEKLHKYDTYYDDYYISSSNSSVNRVPINEAKEELLQVRMIAEMLLIRSINTYRGDKYKLIFRSTLSLIKWNLNCDDLDAVLDHGDQISVYIDDALAILPNDFNIIAVICDIYYHVLTAKLKGKLPTSEIRDQIDRYIPFLIVAADKVKYKYNAALILGEIADAFLANEEPYVACQYYRKVMDIISSIDEHDNVRKREFAVFIGHYSVALLQCDEVEYDLVERNLDLEETLYEQLHQEIGDIRSKMDLAIAYSHRANYYTDKEDYRNAAFSHLKKISVIKETFQLKDNESPYSEEDRLNSLYMSLQPIINYGLLSNENERSSVFKQVYALLANVLEHVYDIKLVMYLNAFAMEIFNATKGTDDEEAEEYLFKKLLFLTLLVQKYGMEDEIKSDFKSTIQEAEPFIERVGDNLDPDNKEIWKLVNRLIYLSDNPKQGVVSRFKTFLANVIKNK